MSKFLLFFLLLSPVLALGQIVEHHVYALKLNLNQSFYKDHSLKEIRYYEEDAAVINGGSFLTKVQFFDTEGKLTNEVTLDYTGNDTTTTTISYEEGRVVEMTISHPFYGSESAFFKYDQNGRISRHERTGMQPAQFYYTYDGEERITQVVEKMQEQNGSWYESGRTMIEYDADGRMIKSSEYEMGYLQGHTIYRYDASGNLVRLSRYEQEDLVMEVYYSYVDGLLSTTRTEIPSLDIIAKQRVEYVRWE